MLKRITLVAGIIVALGVAGYAALGGFRQVEISHQSVSGYLLAGVTYQGKSNDRELRELFNQTRELNEIGKLPGTLTAVYYDTTGEDQGNVHAFVGVRVADSSVALPPTYQYRKLTTNEVVRAKIRSHPAVAPAPNKVKKQLMDYAWQNRLKPQPVVIEQYVNRSNIVVEIPVDK